MAGVSQGRGICTSRAYWELRAEQVMNRVFSPEMAIEVEVFDPPSAPPPPPAPPAPGPRTAASAQAHPAVGQSPPSALVLASVSLGITTVAGLGLVALQLRSQDQQAIRQERNLLMMERLRAMGPASPDPAASSGNTIQAGAAAGGLEALAAAENGLPPPPPAEPWMQELATLPPSSAPSARVLQVPMSGSVGRSAPPAGPSGAQPRPGGSAGSGGSWGGPAPQLIGVVKAPGHGGSAIFQVGSSSTSATVGETIGASGWKLHSANADSAVIERNGEQRLISISSGG
jgi:hypothetical protein